jgi:hypothetical protein
MYCQSLSHPRLAALFGHRALPYLFALLPAVLLLATPAGAQAQLDSPGQAKARQFLNKNHKDILLFAQPGAILKGTRLDLYGVKGQNQQPIPGHFAFRVTYTWESGAFGGSATSWLDFIFDSNGYLYGLNDAGTTSAFGNFKTTDVAIEVLKKAIRGQLPNVQNPNDRQTLEFLVNNSRDSRTMLLGLMKVTQNFTR